MRARAASPRTVSSLRSSSRAASASASLGFLCRTAEYVLTESAPVPKRAASLGIAPRSLPNSLGSAAPRWVCSCVAGQPRDAPPSGGGRSALDAELGERSGHHPVAAWGLEGIERAQGLAGPLLERRAQRALGPGEPLLHRLRSELEEVGHLGGGELLHLPENEHRPVESGQLVDQPLHHPQQLRAGQEILRP